MNIQLERREDGLYWPEGSKNYGTKYVSSAKDMTMAYAQCRQRRLALQAGGHMGAWPLWLSQRFKGVITFEPHPANYRALVENVRDTNVLTFMGALSDKQGLARLAEAVRGTGGHSLLEIQKSALVEYVVQTYVIDSMGLDNLDLLVLDIEGYELPALQGAAQTLARCQPVIHLEDRGHGVKKGRGDTFADLAAYLEELCGYAIIHRVGHDVVFKVPA